VLGELARYSLWAAQRRITGWRGSATWRQAHFATAGELRRLFRNAGASAVSARYGLYLPPWDAPALFGRAEAIERLGRPLGALGAAFVVARAEAGSEGATRLRMSDRFACANPYLTADRTSLRGDDLLQ